MCDYVSELNLHVKALVINFPAFSESNELSFFFRSLSRSDFSSESPVIPLILSENPCGNLRERQPERDGKLQTREYGKQGVENESCTVKYDKVNVCLMGKIHN